MDMENFWVNVLWSLAPSVLIGGLFWFILRSVFRSDRNERAAYARVEAEERLKRGLPDKTAP